MRFFDDGPHGWGFWHVQFAQMGENAHVVCSISKALPRAGQVTSFVSIEYEMSGVPMTMSSRALFAKRFIVVEKK
jgi:hypothetical protein